MDLEFQYPYSNSWKRKKKQANEGKSIYKKAEDNIFEMKKDLTFQMNTIIEEHWGGWGGKDLYLIQQDQSLQEKRK